MEGSKVENESKKMNLFDGRDGLQTNCMGAEEGVEHRWACGELRVIEIQRQDSLSMFPAETIELSKISN